MYTTFYIFTSLVVHRVTVGQTFFDQSYIIKLNIHVYLFKLHELKSLITVNKKVDITALMNVVPRSTKNTNGETEN